MSSNQLCDTPAVIFASPEYLARSGTPRTPADLCQHQWITFSVVSTPIPGSIQHKITQQPETIQVSGNLKTNSVDGVIAAAKHGLGVSPMAKATVYEELHTGKLIQLLDDYELDPVEVYAVYPHREHLPPKVRIFMDFFEKHCANASWALPR